MHGKYKPLNPASPAKTSRLPSHSTMTIVENSICVCFITLKHQKFKKNSALIVKFILFKAVKIVKRCWILKKRRYIKFYYYYYYYY